MDSQSTGSLLSTTETYQCTRAESNLTWFEALTKGLTKVSLKVLTEKSPAGVSVNKFDTSRSRDRDSATKKIW